MKKAEYVLLGILFLLHIAYIPNGFIWLDHGDIEYGRTIVKSDFIRNIFLRGFGETTFYRPVVTIFNNLDHIFYGQYAPGYHLTNIIIFMCILWVLPRFLSVFFNLGKRESLVTQLIAGIVPVHILPVGAIAYRPELLMTLSTMCSLYIYQRLMMSGYIYRLLFVISVIMAFMSKETALFYIPALIIIYEGNLRYRLLTRKSLWYLFGCLMIYFFLRIAALGLAWSIKSTAMSIMDSIITRLAVVSKLLITMASPNVPDVSDVVFIGLMRGVDWVVIIALFVVLLYGFTRKLRGDWARVLLLIMVGIIPALNIVPLPRFYSPHYAFFAGMIFPVVFILVVRMVHKAKYKPAVYGLMILWIIIAIYSTFTAGWRFENDYSFFHEEVIHDDNFSEGHAYLGDYYFGEKEYASAEEEYKRAIRKNKNIYAFVDRTAVAVNYAGLQLVQKKYDEADLLLQNIKPASQFHKDLILYNRAVIMIEKKDYDKADEFANQISGGSKNKRVGLIKEMIRERKGN